MITTVVESDGGDDTPSKPRADTYSTLVGGWVEVTKAERVVTGGWWGCSAVRWRWC